MIDWLHGLPFVWLVVVVFGATYLVAAAISWVVLRLAVGERARAFKAVSHGLLPPLGVVFGLVVGFLAVQVWNDVGQAQTAVNEGDGEQGQVRQQNDACPLGPVDPRFADDDALPPCVKGGFERGDHLPLRHFLALRARLECEC